MARRQAACVPLRHDCDAWRDSVRDRAARGRTAKAAIVGSRPSDLQCFNEDFGGQVLSFDSEAADDFADIAARRREAGRPISQLDAMIAAMTCSRGASFSRRETRRTSRAAESKCSILGRIERQGEARELLCRERMKVEGIQDWKDENVDAEKQSQPASDWAEFAANDKVN